MIRENNEKPAATPAGTKQKTANGLGGACGKSRRRTPRSTCKQTNREENKHKEKKHKQQQHQQQAHTTQPWIQMARNHRMNVCAWRCNTHGTGPTWTALSYKCIGLPLAREDPKTQDPKTQATSSPHGAESSGGPPQGQPCIHPEDHRGSPRTGQRPLGNQLRQPTGPANQTRVECWIRAPPNPPAEAPPNTLNQACFSAVLPERLSVDLWPRLLCTEMSPDSLNLLILKLPPPFYWDSTSLRCSFMLSTCCQ